MLGAEKTQQQLATVAAVSHTVSPIWELSVPSGMLQHPCNMGRVDIYVSSNPAKQREWKVTGGPRQDVEESRG